PANEIAAVWEIRLPRILCGFFVGSGLSVCGSIFQSILKNPLADPYTIGISSGSAFGASLALFLNIVWGFYFSETLFAFAFSFLTLILVISIAKKSGDISSSSIIVAGIIVSAIFSSGISFIKMLAGESVGAIVFWIMGSLSAVSYKDVLVVVPVVIILTIVSVFFAKYLNAMSLGDKMASSLGVNTKKLRLIFLIIGAFLTAVCVSVSGIIGFVGLVIPHILRVRLTSDNKKLIPLCFLCGGSVLLIADNITRIFFGGSIPVGVLTTLIGGPFFIYVYTSKGGRFYE
ncbi:MAG: iron ABC transporter permease, partial [Oscillospiraceae bacterium]